MSILKQLSVRVACFALAKSFILIQVIICSILKHGQQSRGNCQIFGFKLENYNIFHLKNNFNLLSNNKTNWLGPASSEGDCLLHKIISSNDPSSIPGDTKNFFAPNKINLILRKMSLVWNQHAIYWKQTVAIFPVSKRVMM